MATYEAPRYKELGFYVDGEFRRFSGGLYHTDDAAEIAVLDTLMDAVKIDENAAEEPVVKPAPKTPRKAGTSSAK